MVIDDECNVLRLWNPGRHRRGTNGGEVAGASGGNESFA